MFDSSVREWIVTAHSFILMFWNGGFAQLEYFLLKFWFKNNMKTSILDQAMQSGLTQNETLGGLLCLFYRHFVCFRLNLTWIIFAVCCSATRPKGTRPCSSSCCSFTALLFPLDSCETTCAGRQPRGFESPWIDAQTNFGKANQVMGRAQQGAPESWLALCCSEFRTLLILQVCRAPYSTSGLRGKDGGWKGNYFLLQLSVPMTQIGEVCKLKEMPGWIWNWDLGYIFQWFLY